MKRKFLILIKNLSYLEPTLSVFTPPERLTVDKWAEKHIILPADKTCPEPGPLKLSRTPYVRGPLQAFGSKYIDMLVLVWGRQTGKALSLDTLLPTKKGWIKMGDIKVGNKLFDEAGNLCLVKKVYPILYERDCYKITFSDNASIITDAEHLWKVRIKQRKRTGRGKNRKEIGGHEIKIKATKDMLNNFFKRGVNQYSIQVANALQLSEKKLPIPPYTLGAWLGDGNSKNGGITLHQNDWQIAKEIMSEKIPIKIRESRKTALMRIILKPEIFNGTCRRGHSWLFYKSKHGHCKECLRLYQQKKLKPFKEFVTFYKMLLRNNLLGNKHIPSEYLRASYKQRLSLLQGLMDTDGTCNKGMCSFTNTNKKIAHRVLELIRSLGLNPKLKIREAKLYGRKIGIAYQIDFTAYKEQIKIFRLKRKYEKQSSLQQGIRRPEQVNHRYITKIEKINSVPVRCIEVDSPSHLYLAGESMIPTHNSSGCLYIPMCYTIAQDPGPILFVLPNDALVDYTSTNRIKPIFENCPAVWNKVSATKDDYTTREMIFRGSIVSLIGAGSVPQLMSRPVRYLFLDEIDQIKELGGQGTDPLKTVEQTTTAYINRKIIYTSTPTTEEGNIWYHLRTCQKVFEYWVPCPHCKKLQVLIWSQIKFPENVRDPHKAFTNTWYECIHCNKKIKNDEKDWMCNHGQWRSRENTITCIMDNIITPIKDTISLNDALEDISISKIGFHLPKWYGLFHFSSFGEAVKEFLEANNEYKEFGTIEKLRDWTHYWAARPWKERIETRKSLEIEKNKINLSSLIAPQGTIALTMGVDPGQGGYWYAVLAWREDLSPHLTDYGFLDGAENLADFIWNSSYQSEKGEHFSIFRAGMDTGGSRYEELDEGMTEAAYTWLRQYGKGKVFGTKGASFSMGKRMKISHIDKMPKGGKIPGGLSLWLLDTVEFKDALHYRLQIPEGQPGRMTFHSETGVDYFNHLLSEEKRRNKKTGKVEYIRLKKENHLLDTTVIAMAMADPECIGGVRRLLLQQKVPIRRRMISEGIKRE